jgi:4-hydroxy-tetrahydrodipicolinate synthase
MTSPSVALTGSIVALITPMLEDGSVDYPSLRKLIDWHVAEGTNCIGVVGTTGESPTVNVEEHCEIIRVAVEQAAGRVSIMAGCGANSTHEAIELAKYAKKVGADSQLQVVPYYNKPTGRPVPALQGHRRSHWRPARGSVQRARPLGCGHAA